MALNREDKLRAHSEKMRRLRAANPEHYRAIGRASYQRHKERLARERKAKPGYRERVKWNNRKRLLAQYGITPEQYQELVTAHGSICAICGEPERRVINGFPASLAIDHDHISGAIRGLLCNKCNVGIGMFRTNPSLLEKAIVYLRRP